VRRNRTAYRTGAVQIGLVASSALLSRAAFPDVGLWPLAWVALVPALIACEGRSPGRATGLGLVWGALVLSTTCHWLLRVPGVRWDHALVLVTVLALPNAAWFFGLSFLGNAAPLVRTTLGAAAWVGLDWLRAHAGFRGRKEESKTKERK
jgi:apolipoprotein N-acyltransferase